LRGKLLSRSVLVKNISTPTMAVRFDAAATPSGAPAPVVGVPVP
jgi:hypothetical protein